MKSLIVNSVLVLTLISGSAFAETVSTTSTTTAGNASVTHEKTTVGTGNTVGTVHKTTVHKVKRKPKVKVKKRHVVKSTRTEIIHND